MIVKIYLKYLVIIFIIICITIVLLINLYYITPSNYKLCKSKSNLKLLNTEEIKIEPNSYAKLDYNNYKNKYFKINCKQKLKLIFYNFIKSQNLIYNHDDKYLIKLSFYSDLIIFNNFKKPLIIKVDYFL